MRVTVLSWGNQRVKTAGLEATGAAFSQSASPVV